MLPAVQLHLRIGEVARRTGLSADVLRAWERRYGIPRPVRTRGGFRLYSLEEVERLERMRTLVASGLAPAEAARAVSEPSAGSELPALPQLAAALDAAIQGLDEPAAHAVIDRLLASFGVETVLEEVLLPCLRSLGERWACGQITVAHEHFASSVIRGRLLGLTRGWGEGVGPLAVLACPAGELHDLGLMAFGILLARLGWRVTFLGADTPLESLARVADRLRPDAVVLAITVIEPSPSDVEALRSLGRRHALYLGGARGAAVARGTGAAALPVQMREAARFLALGSADAGGAATDGSVRSSEGIRG
jgi:DNA-binding transcriptional MerR regulator